MLFEGIIITAIVCGTLLFGYVFKLCFMSKCDSVDCCKGAIKVHRSVASEQQNVSSLKLPIGPP